MDQPELVELVTITLGCEIPMFFSEYSLAGEFPPEALRQEGYLVKVRAAAEPFLSQTRLFEIAKLKHIAVNLAVIEPNRPIPQVFSKIVKRDQLFIYKKSFYWSQIPRGDEEFLKFSIAEQDLALRHVSQYFRLEPVPVGTTIATVEVDESEEVHLFVKLDDANFGNAQELYEKSLLTEKINDALLENGLGHSDSDEVGVGFFVIFCIGASAQRIGECIKLRFANELPEGSYIELHQKGGIRKENMKR